jgi:tetratricopeptide (TPR) repeat protein/predicted Ser/Thr protein kinase
MTDDAPTTLGVGPSTVPKARDSAVRLVLGSKLGERYRVDAFVGEGGMGAVYRATDEKLSVDVALKVVRGARADKALRDEVRLAQKVTHRNVCRTYDLEDVDGHSFIKMEYVPGETLAARLKRGRLEIAEAIWIARGLADGLLAAHLQGIVHRDLKPGNVILAKDRPVLMDFGIARTVEGPSQGMAGTVGYMAPEQFTNTNVDQRADLYALGCLLFEMLSGEPVFGKGSAIELATRHVAVVPANVRTLRPDVPRWLARAVEALLAKDPAKRPAGVARLLAGPRSPWKIAVPVAALAAVGVVVLALPSARSELCKGTERRLAGIWDAAMRKQVEQAFLATKKPFAAASFAGVERVLDGYARAWTAAETESCEATRIRGEQSEEIQELREECLGERLEQLRAVSQLVATADANVVQAGDQIARALDPLDACSNIAALRAPGQVPPELREPIKDTQKVMFEARAKAFVGETLPALVGTKQALDRAIQLRYEPLLAQAHWHRGAAELTAGDTEGALSEDGEAVYAALRGKRDDYAADCALSAAIVSMSLGRRGEAKIWLGIAGSAAKRIGIEARFERRRLEVDGLLAMEAGDLNTGVAEQEKALAMAEVELGRDSPLLFESESTLGEALSKAGAYRKAVPHYERALALREKAVGPDHPDIAAILTNLGGSYTHMREHQKGKVVFERALAIRERMFGKQSPFLIATLDNYGELLRGAGDIPAALATQERALAIAKVVPGVDNPMYQQIATDYADTLVAANRPADARTLLDAVIAVEDKQASALLPLTLAARADAAVAAKAWDDAAADADRSISGYEAAGGKDNAPLWRPLTTRARVALAHGHAADARPLLERAIAIGQRAQVTDEDLAATRQMLAQLKR